MSDVHASSAQIRRDLGHPVIDADGHMLEAIKAAHPFLREHLPADRFEAFLESGSAILRPRRPLSRADRDAARIPQNAWWGTHTVNVLDRATASLPALMYERLDEMGIDVSILYPTNTLGTTRVFDDELRRGLCAGYNAFFADIYGPYADRLLPAGIIPMHTPEEAIAEMEHCHELGLRVVALPEGVLRPMAVAATESSSPWLFPGQTHWFDTFGLDSAYDYDPVWRKAQELGYAITFHGGLTGRPGVCSSTTNYVANHVGMFQQLMYPLTKSLFFGGVARRFPDLPFVFLECGVSWAAQMLIDILEHWEKRNVRALEAFDPARLDRDRLVELMDRHGGRLLDLLGSDAYRYVEDLPIANTPPDDRDEFRHIVAGSKAEIVEQFSRSFYFGCEADDRGVTTAFSGMVPADGRLKPVFSSDIGHWDVTDVTGVVAESYELLQDRMLTAEQYRAFMFGNAYEMFTAVNPAFFDGTPIASRRP